MDSNDFCIDKIKIRFADIQPGENRQADCILQTMPVKSDRFPDMSLEPVALGGAAVFLRDKNSTAKIIALLPHQGKIIPRDSIAGLQKAVNIGLAFQAASPGQFISFEQL
jgi:hypothetical protein